MATKKQETQINNLWNKIKTLNLSKDEIDYMNVQGFLYSVDRINILQVVAIMTQMCLSKNLTLEEITELLK